MNRHVYILASILAAVGAGLFVYRAIALQVPLFPAEFAEYWQVEARLGFTGADRPTKATIFEPRSSGRFVIVDQRFVSQGFGLTTTTDNGTRRLSFAKRRARGLQAVYYLFTVHAGNPRSFRQKESPTTISQPKWTEAQQAAAEDVLSAARQQSADVSTLVGLLLKRLATEPPDPAISILLGKKINALRRVEVARNILSMERIPARSVHGIDLTGNQRSTPIIHWLEVFIDGRWNSYLVNSTAQNIPETYFPWWRGPAPLAELEGAAGLKVNIAVSQALEPVLRSEAAAQTAAKNGLSSFSFLALPLDVQQVYRILLVVPLGVLLLVVLRNVVGVRTFGTFMPVLIALAFRETELLWGIVLFTFVVALGLSVRLYFENLKLLVVPRLAAVLIVVIVSMAILSILSHKLGFERGLSVALFPMVILTMTVERLSVIWDERGPTEALVQGLGSLVISVICYLIMISPYAEHLMFVFPELLLVLLAGILLLGRYSGYRILELSRFKVLAGKDTRC